MNSPVEKLAPHCQYLKFVLIDILLRDSKENDVNWSKQQLLVTFDGFCLQSKQFLNVKILNIKTSDHSLCLAFQRNWRQYV